MSEWLYAQLYPGDAHRMDEVLVGAVRQARDEALAAGATMWFFIRYADARGPHVRMRVAGDTDLVNELFARWTRELVRRLAPTDAALSARSAQEVTFAVYEPEWTKWGGPVGTALAERAFRIGSDVALDLLAEVPRPDARLALVGLLMRRIAQDADPEFWALHDRFWRPATGAPGQELSMESCLCLDKQEATVAASTVATALIQDAAQAVARALAGAADARVSVGTKHLLLHHLHMMVNRLGVLPRQEWQLGRRIAMKLPGIPAAPPMTPSWSDRR